MTPEEKLLALIQQEKAPATPAAEPPKVTPPVEPIPIASTVKVAAGEKAPVLEEGISKKNASLPEVKPKLPAHQREVKVADPLPVNAEKKLKLSTPAPVPAEPALVRAPLRAEVAASGVGQETVPDVSVSQVAVPVKGYRLPIFRPGQLSGLVLFNRVLAGVVLVLLVVVVYSVASIRADVDSEGVRLESGAGALPIVTATIFKESLPSVDTFLEKVAVRDVFQPKEAAAATATASVLQGKVADLKLLGVSMDSAAAEESMAIIRNKAESRTYFVKKGQLVGDTGYTLERVLSDHAVLKKGKQEIELK